MKCFTYLRTSGDDGKEKAGLPVRRVACAAFAEKNDYEIIAEYSDDGVTGKLPMHARPQGKLLIAALLADDIKTVICYDAKRIGRTQPATLCSMPRELICLEASWEASMECWQSLTV